MPVRGLEAYLREHQLTQTAPLSALANTRLGVDAHAYLEHTVAEAGEPFIPALGGAPLTLSTKVLEDLKTLENEHIKPVFVLDGLPPAQRGRPLATDDVRAATRQEAWEHYENGRLDQAMQSFRRASHLSPRDMMRVVQRMFRQRRVEALAAPYLAPSQLVYLEQHSKSYVHAIYGPTEVLLYPGVDKVILSIDFKAGTFTFVSKISLLANLAMTADQFLDACILSGFDHSPPFPLLATAQSPFKAAVTIMRQYQSGLEVIRANANDPSVIKAGYSDQFLRTHALIRFSLVLVAEEGTISPLPLALPLPNAPPLTAADVPIDLHDIFSNRFPDETYYHLCRGLVGAQLLEVLAAGAWADRAPPCAGETDDYKRFVKEYLTESPQSPRCIALTLITSMLHPFWAKRPINAVYYFDPTHDYAIPHSTQTAVSLTERVASWNVDISLVEEELRRQSVRALFLERADVQSSTIDILLCLGATSASGLANRTRTTKAENRQMEKKDEIVANTVWRFLEMRGMLSAQHLHTPHGKALFQALKPCRVTDKFQEALYIAVELLKAGVLHGGRYGGRVWSGGPMSGSDSDKSSMLLVMRTLSIVPVTFKTEAWHGPLSRELLVFNSFVSTLTRSLRCLVEATAANCLLRGDARRARDDYLEISLSLPFTSEPNTALGIVFKGYFDCVGHLSKDTAAPLGSGQPIDPAVREQALTILERPFAVVRDVRLELQRAWRFWDAVMVVVRSLEADSAIAPPVAQQFAAADAWLGKLRA